RQLRDALVAYYIAHKGYKNSAALFAHFLIDPEMDSCMKTTRIVQATQSAQLLVQRATLGLEPQLCLSADNLREFQWRKHYRLWEANRKVFLYPENYIVPGLRLNKTNFFRQLEDNLLQDEINAQNCEQAFGEYLKQLNKVARLDIRAFYQETEADNHPGNLHVFARTFVTPYVYYYREWSAKFKEWSPWEQLDLDLEGDHLIPAFFNGRLYLFGVLFIEKEHRKIKRVIDGEEQNAPYLELKFHYHKREGGRWSGKHILDGSLLAGHYAGPGCFNNLRRKLGQDVDQVLVRYELPHPFKPPVPVYGPNETYNGNLTLSNGNFQDYAKVSLEQSAFFFHPEARDGDLYIQVYRDFAGEWEAYHNAYTEMAYEDWVKIGGCSEQITIVPPVIEPQPLGKRFLARPFLTLPAAQHLIKGLDAPSSLPATGLYVKTSMAHGPDGIRILTRDHGAYRLSYPQYKHALWQRPFFLNDERHTLFFERPVEQQCRRQWVIDENGEGNYIPYHFEAQDGQYRASLHEHPLACRLLAEYNRYGVEGVLDSRDTNLRKQRYHRPFFAPEYGPVTAYVRTPYPVEDFDFSATGAYSLYNWEAFFHIPSLMAHQLKANGEFAEAIRWLSFIFDPTNQESNSIERFWRIKPFTEEVSQDAIQSLLALLGATGLSPEQERKRAALQAQIERWEDDPFNPHALAALRIRPYMLWTVCEYIDTLIEWGDSLFRQDSREAINEASNLYLLASELLGERPQILDRPQRPLTLCFDDMAGSLTGFSNSIENELTGYRPTVCCEGDDRQEAPAALPALIFCVPDNPKLRELWKKVADRLFKIRHCLNIDGQKRELPLFAPPIDPALLVRARAAGVDIAGILDQLSAAPPRYRFSYLLQKALEYTNEVKSLGGQLLSALEKKDAEELTRMQELHGQNLLAAARNSRALQVEEARQQLKIAEHNKRLVEIRLEEYARREYKSSREDRAIQQTRTAEGFMYAEQSGQLLAGGIVNIPDTYAGPFPLLKLPGGDKLAFQSSSIALGFGILSSIYRNKAAMSSTYAGYDRRQEEWDFQADLAREELRQAEKQVLAAEIRLGLAERELAQHDLQQAQREEVYDFLRRKFTGLDLYSWMSGELAQLNRKAYEMAYGLARQSERALEKELGVPPSIIQFGHWDSQKKGLLAGEQLGLQLRMLEEEYLKKDTRKFELAQAISLKLLDPAALAHLIMGQECRFQTDESLFNLDFPDGRLKNIRIRSVSFSLPCVTGPQVGTHLKASFRDEGQEVVTSTGVNDAAVFEPSFNTPHYLPFEYESVNGEWKIQLPLTPAFDYSTISDLVLRFQLEAELDTAAPMPPAPAGSSNYQSLMLSWRHDFPQDWYKLLEDQPAAMESYSRPGLQLAQAPYRLRKLNFSTGAATHRAYYLAEENGDLILKALSDTSGSVFRQFTFAGGALTAGGLPVKDIWLLFEVV
ncbi:MAG: hypothetical protein KDD02_26470, partial [Phaeodactylibacter sp.]|nr:hypothetical protein [Phaeodactylibacter sp.]